MCVGLQSSQASPSHSKALFFNNSYTVNFDEYDPVVPLNDENSWSSAFLNFLYNSSALEEVLKDIYV